MNILLPAVYFSLEREDSIQQVRNRFTRLYPALNLNFYKNPTQQEECSFNSIIFFPEVKMKEINSSLQDGSVTFTSLTTVKELEHLFFTHFGVSVQLSRLGHQPDSALNNKTLIGIKSVSGMAPEPLRVNHV